MRGVWGRCATATAIGWLVGACAITDAAVAAQDAVLPRAIAVASAHWPGSNCRGRELVTWTSQSALDSEYPGEGLGAVAVPATCSVRLTEDARTWSGRRVCALLAHEFGHLAGRAHTEDPADVMYSGPVPVTGMCTRAFPPSLKPWRSASPAKSRCSAACKACGSATARGTRRKAGACAGGCATAATARCRRSSRARPDAVEAVVDWCRRGPPRAEIERVEVDDAEPRGLTGFDVR